jgi:broad specificity phosphatase PhoE
MPPAVAREDTSLNDDCYRTITLFLIRHGQASHNVEEQAAQKLAQQICLSQGLAADAPLTKERMEQARQEILENPTFFDAELSIQGSREATDASNDLQTICDNLGIAFPTEVMVSPLQRTLQTASLIFPNHKNMLVREELRERLTGRPADNRASSAELSKNESFKHLDFHHIRVKSLVNDLTDIFGMQQVMQDLQEIEEADDESISLNTTYGSCGSLSQLATSSSRNSLSQLATSSSRNSLAQMANSASRNSLCQLASSSSKNSLRDSQRGSSCNADALVEDEPQLAARTKKIMPLLLQSSHTHIALVTHKGYLRALEKTQLHQGPATRNFGNGEIRVYRATIHKSRKQVERITRLH